jgi:hypothetical protein
MAPQFTAMSLYYTAADSPTAGIDFAANHDITLAPCLHVQSSPQPPLSFSVCCVHLND